MILYHASPHKNLTIIKPQKTLSQNKFIGYYVFATSSHTMATMYLVPRGIPTLMDPNGPEKNIVICATADNFTSKDIGGAIYELPSEDFDSTPQSGLEEYELVSKKSIKPVQKHVYKSSLDALREADIAVRFVNEDTFTKLIRHPNQAKEIKSIPRYI